MNAVRDILNKSVALYASCKSATTKDSILLKSYFDGIKNGEWKEEVCHYRLGKIKKASVRAVTSSGKFLRRSETHKDQHSNLI
jgi:hypothetical protein